MPLYFAKLWVVLIISLLAIVAFLTFLAIVSINTIRTQQPHDYTGTLPTGFAFILFWSVA